MRTCACGASIVRGYICDDCNRRKTQEFRAKRRELGLCTRCDEPARPGGLLCEAHRQQTTERERPPGARRKEDVLADVAHRRAVKKALEDAPWVTGKTLARGDVLVFLGEGSPTLSRVDWEGGRDTVKVGDEVRVVATRSTLTVVEKEGRFLRLHQRAGWKIVRRAPPPEPPAEVEVEHAFVSSWWDPVEGVIQTKHELEAAPPFKDQWDTDLDAFDVSCRTLNFFDREGLKTLGDLRRLGEIQPGQYPNVGRKTIDEVRRLLKDSGSFRMVPDRTERP